MMRMHFLTLTMVCTSFFLAACDTTETTTGQGYVQGAGGKNAQSVTFQVIEEFFEDGHKAIATISGGEVFKGKMVIVKKETSEIGSGFNFGDDDDLLVLSDSTTYSSKATGLLFSPTRSMQCTLSLNTPSYGFSGGGVGQCKISTGEVINIQL